MDFDSLKISGNDIEKTNYAVTDYSNMSQKLETKIADEKVKVNNTSSAKAGDNNQKKTKNIVNDEETASNYKGSYSFEELESAIKIANEKLKETSRQFSYSIHDATKQIMIKITDSDGQVIKEIPSEESLDFYAKLQELSGILLDKKR